MRLLLLLGLAPATSEAATPGDVPPVVNTVELGVSGLSWAPVADGTALLRSLARSPLWSVTWDRDGAVVARFRTVFQVAPRDSVVALDAGRAPLNDWLGAWVAAGAPPPQSSEMVAALENGPLQRGDSWVSIEVTNAPPPGDLALLIVEDCAVYLDGPGSRRHGSFSGSAPFEAEIRWLDRQGRAIDTQRGPFWGWER